MGSALSPADLGIGRLFEAVRDAVVVADVSSGRIVLWNPAAERLFGYSTAEALGLSVEALVPAHLVDRHRAGLDHYRATGRGRIVDGGLAVEVSASHKSGAELVVELSLSPIPDPASAGRFVMAIIRDVTERAQLRLAAEQRLRSLEALYRADERMHRSLRLEEVLQALVDVATDVLRADKTAVLVWDARGEQLVVGAAHGFRPETLAALHFAPGEGIAGQVAARGEALAVDDLQLDPRIPPHLRAVLEREPVRSLIAAPIVVGGVVFGVFNVNYAQPHAPGSEERRLLLALAQRAALAIENAQLYAQAQQVAALEERQRLARDLHDAVTQSLFAASITADALAQLWERDPPQGRQRLADLRRLTRGALAEMRALLLELRPGALAEVGLGDLLVRLAEASGGRSLLDVQVEVEGQRPLPPDVQVALYRIAQEALNNTLKHAAAGRALLELRAGSERVELRIRDDGHGFDLEQTAAGHFGLAIMQERARGVGAQLRVESRPGAGTEVVVTWADPAAASVPS